jgi:hypothetical protein
MKKYLVLLFTGLLIVSCGGAGEESTQEELTELIHGIKFDMSEDEYQEHVNGLLDKGTLDMVNEAPNCKFDFGEKVSNHRFCYGEMEPIFKENKLKKLLIIVSHVEEHSDGHFILENLVGYYEAKHGEKTVISEDGYGDDVYEWNFTNAKITLNERLMNVLITYEAL